MLKVLISAAGASAKWANVQTVEGYTPKDPLRYVKNQLWCAGYEATLYHQPSDQSTKLTPVATLNRDGQWEHFCKISELEG